MLRATVPSVLKGLEGAAAAALGSAGANRSYQSLGNFSFPSTEGAPTASSSNSIKVSASAKAGAVDVSVSAGGASASAKYSAADVRKLAAHGIELKDVARVSVLHSSFVDYLVKLTAERYAVLAQWPDFTTAYGKEYYYRAHPDDLKAFYKAADAFHSAYDALTEFDSLSPLASELLPGYSKRRHNVLGPAVGPTVANAAVAQFLLAHAK